MKSLKLTIGIILIFTLAFFIFFSKSVYSFNVPTVTATLPTNGTLTKSETVTGIIDWLNVSETYSEIGGKIEKVHVSEGDTVKKGQALISFSFSEDDILTKLKELEVSGNKLQIDLENLDIRLERINRYIVELESEEYEEDEISRFDLNQLASKIEAKRDEYETTKILYEAGGTAKQALDSLEAEINSLIEQYANMEETIEDQERKLDEAIAEKEKNREKQLLEYQHDITTINQDIKTKKLDLENLSIQEENYKKTLSDYKNNAVVYSSANCVVTEIKVNEGQHVNAGALLMTFGIGIDYKIETIISLDNNFVTVGDECTLYNSSYANYLYGAVSKITPQSGGKMVTVVISSEELSPGESFEITFEKESLKKGVLVPNGAVNQDNDGYFVYQVKRRDGILGKEFYAEKLRIYIGDSDDSNTMITNGVTFFEPIVLLSDKAFSENDVIKIKNEGDFFASE